MHDFTGAEWQLIERALSHYRQAVIEDIASAKAGGYNHVASASTIERNAIDTVLNKIANS